MKKKVSITSITKLQAYADTEHDHSRGEWDCPACAANHVLERVEAEATQAIGVLELREKQRGEK